MSGLFDRLLDHSDDDENQPSGGLSPLDIADLPALQRRILFTLLRDKEAASGGITLEALAEKLDHPDELAATLNELASNDWLLTLGEPPAVRYKVNLRHKRPRPQGGGLWSALANRLADDPASSAANPAPSVPDTPSASPPDSPHPDSRDQDSRPRRPPFPDISKW